MRCAWRPGIVEARAVSGEEGERSAWIVEDEPAVASLAVDLCAEHGATPSVFRRSQPFMHALRAGPPPTVLILDWRLENELSAALFMATRHRYPRLPIVYWTGSRADGLPSMIRADPHAVVVDKAEGTSAFEEALDWALDERREAPHGSLPAV
jgi:DNA-binding NtrC family response regulator